MNYGVIKMKMSLEAPSPFIAVPAVISKMGVTDQTFGKCTPGQGIWGTYFPKRGRSAVQVGCKLFCKQYTIAYAMYIVVP